MPTSTPWGVAQSKKKYYRGINSYSTAGHGGFKISEKLNKQIPDYMRHEDGWYEEDCDWCKPVVVFRELTPELQELYYNYADKCFRNWFPDEYERYFNVVLQPGDSSQKDERQWYKEREGWWFGQSAFGDWHDKVPKDHVGVIMKRKEGTQELAILVTKQVYDSRGGRPYALSPDDMKQRYVHLRWEKDAK